MCVRDRNGLRGSACGLCGVVIGDSGRDGRGGGGGAAPGRPKSADLCRWAYWLSGAIPSSDPGTLGSKPAFLGVLLVLLRFTPGELALPREAWNAAQADWRSSAPSAAED